MAVDQETLSAVSQLLDQKLASPASSAGAGFGQLGGPLQAPQAFSPAGISFRIKIILPDGREVSPYIHFGPEQCATAEAILGTIQALMNLGVPIDTYTPRQPQGGGGWGGGQQGGGGGYNRGGGGGYGYQGNRGGGGGGGRW